MSASQAPSTREDLKLTCYFGERDRIGGRLVADVLLDLYGRHELQSSILLRGAMGFGLEHHLRTDRLLTLSEDLPVVAVAVDTGPRIERVLEEVQQVAHRGLLTLERARMLTGNADGGNSGVIPQAVTGHAEETKLTIYVGRHERSIGDRPAGRPAFAAVCELLHREQVAGATVLLGVDGTRHGTRIRARFFAANERVPTMILAVGSNESIAASLTQLEGMLHEPVLTLERVRVCKRDGQPLAAPHEPPGTDPHGLALWQKLTVVSSEAALYEGRALHLELVRRLRGAGAAGATSLRGIWGFHGDHAPHGDRPLSLRRHVPIVTILVDSPERIAQVYPIVDELTRERGLVTSEVVPAMSARTHHERRGGTQLAQSSH